MNFVNLVPEALSDAAYGGGSGVLTLNTYELPLNTSLDFMVIVTKDSQQLVLRQSVYVTEGDPPEVEIQ